MSDLTYHQKNRDLMQNRAKDYYENDKERLKEQARNKYRNLSEERKNKRREYGKTDTIICLKKNKLTEYQKKYCEAKKSQSNNQLCMQCFLIHNIYVNGFIVIKILLTNFSLDSLSDSVSSLSDTSDSLFSKPSSIILSIFIFSCSYLHSSKSF